VISNELDKLNEKQFPKHHPFFRHPTTYAQEKQIPANISVNLSIKRFEYAVKLNVSVGQTKRDRFVGLESQARPYLDCQWKS
jgi:hypothetical protein